MGTTLETTGELEIKLKLSKHATEGLERRAAESGRDVASVASDLIEQAVSRPTVDELLAGFRKQVDESGMSDDELDAFHRGLLAKVRCEKKARS